MFEGLYIASSGGMKQQRNLEILSNNLANLNTPGFKKDQLVFEELLPTFKDVGSLETARNTLLPPAIANNDVSYVGVAAQFTDFKQGDLIKTGNIFDIALEGEGFFSVQTPQGIRYTRVGSFQINAEGQLITKNGDPVVEKGDDTVFLPPGVSGVTIDKQGTLSTLSAGAEADIQPIGQLKVVRFENQSDLVKEGNGLFMLANPNAQAIETEDAKVLQGFIETSNVNAVEEMIRMIETVRTFEAYQKIIQSIDEADSQAINSIARLA